MRKFAQKLIIVLSRFVVVTVAFIVIGEMAFRSIGL
jgi:hypothetical protein